MTTRLSLLHSVFLDNCFVGRVELFRLGVVRINYFNKNSIKTTESYLYDSDTFEWMSEYVKSSNPCFNEQQENFRRFLLGPDGLNAKNYI